MMMFWLGVIIMERAEEDQWLTRGVWWALS